MKVLILTESIAGSGHTKAAHNVAKGVQLIYPGAEVKVDTSLSKVSPFLEKWTSRLYMNTIHHASSVWGWAYQRDKEWSSIGKDFLSAFISRRLEPYLRSEAPDIIISTHAFCLGGLARLKHKMKKQFILGAAMTDYCVHQFWIYDEVDLYFVGAEELKQKLLEVHSVDPNKVHVTGIPIDPLFDSEFSYSDFRTGYRIPEKSTLILITGGGLGLAPYRDILEVLQLVEAPLYLVVLTGTNQKVKKELEILREEYPHPLLLLDYVENMNEWMKAADLLIGKPGGLTVSEALACQLPLIIYKPIPGQEEKNSKFLTDVKVAIRAENKEQLMAGVRQLCSEPELLKVMQERSAELGKASAAYELGKILLHNSTEESFKTDSH
jgi:processive 1,2-diacylglycerol beta-glucosyltransferase